MNKLQKFWRLVAIAAIMASALNLSLMPATPVQALSSDLVISQIYGAGGGAGALYTNDYVEIFNRGTSTVSLSGYSVQYASASGTGNFSLSATLSGNLAAGKYYLVQLASGGAVGSPMPTPDATGSTNMSGTAGKVILANVTTALACNGGSTPCNATQLSQIVDLIGYGTANFFEGTAAAPAASATLAVFRNSNGCAETDQNSADFATGTPSPRNSASTANPCTPPIPSLSINDVSVTEGDSGTTAASFTVTLSEAAPAGGVTFDIATSDGDRKSVV